MGFVKLLLKSGTYMAALVGLFILLPLNDNVTFTKYSVAPEKSFTGPLAMNEKLSGIHKIFEDQIRGPEGLLYRNNTLYTTVNFGHVVKMVDNQFVPVAKFGKDCDGLYEEHICGRPLGLSMDRNGFLYVADAYYGIFKVNVNSKNQYGAIEQLVSMEEVIDGSRPKLPNAVIVATDGIVYWTDADVNFALNDSLYAFYADGTGRLLKYDPKTKKNTVLVKNIYFANGLQLSDDETFIIISETGKYRILKYYLKGNNAGTTEVFIDGLPGMPDNIKKIGKFFYIPLGFSRMPVFDYIGEYPIIRMMCFKLFRTIDITLRTIDLYFPHVVWKKAAFWVGHFELTPFIKSIIKSRFSILKVSEEGIIISSFHSTDGLVMGISDVEIIDDKLYFGSPFNNFLGVLNVPHGFL